MSSDAIFASLRKRPGVISRAVGSEFVLIHPQTQQAHSLAGPAAAVWAAVDGADLPPLTAAEIETAIAELRGLDLLCDVNSRGVDGISRRSALKRAGVLAAATGVATIALPEVVAAASPTYRYQRTTPGPVSTTVPANNTNSARPVSITLLGAGGGEGACSGGGSGAALTAVFIQPAHAAAFQILGSVGGGGGSGLGSRQSTGGAGGLSAASVAGFTGAGGAGGGTTCGYLGGGGGAASFLYVVGASYPFLVAGAGGGSGSAPGSAGAGGAASSTSGVQNGSEVSNAGASGVPGTLITGSSSKPVSNQQGLGGVSTGPASPGSGGTRTAGRGGQASTLSSGFVAGGNGNATSGVGGLGGTFSPKTACGDVIAGSGGGGGGGFAAGGGGASGGSTSSPRTRAGGAGGGGGSNYVPTSFIANGATYTLKSVTVSLPGNGGIYNSQTNSTGKGGDGSVVIGLG